MRGVAGVVVVWSLVATGCGRFGFDDAHAGADGPAGDASADAAATPDAGSLAPIACGAPFELGATAGSNSQLALVGTPDGVVAIVTDASRAVRVWSAKRDDGGALLPAASAAPLDVVSNGLVDAIAAGDGVLAVTYDGSNAHVQQLDGVGTRIGAPRTRAGEVPATGALAASGSTGGGQALAYASYGAVGAIVARHVDVTGADLDAAVAIADVAETPTSLSLAPAATGYVATWTDTASSPNRARIELLDDSFAVVAGPVTASTDGFDAAPGAVAWASASHAYLVAWHEKTATDSDQIWMRVYDPTLAPISDAATILDASITPRVASGGAAFSVISGDYGTSSLAVQRVDASGSAGVAANLESGSVPDSWSAAPRGDQTIGGWVTAGALWVDAPCAP